MAVPFHRLLKSHRMATGLTLRAFCRDRDIDPGEQSRMERGLSPAPMGMFFVKKLGDALGLKYGTPDWDEFRDSAAASHGRLPSDLRTNQRLLAKLPVLFGALRSGGCPAEKLDAMIELVRETAEQNETEKESDMARPRKPYQPVGAFEQIDRIMNAAAGLAPNVAASFWVMFGPLLAEMLQSWLESCPDESAERTAKRMARIGRVARLRFVNEFVREARLEGDRIRRKDARVMFSAAIADAKANPKDTEASILELRG